MDFVGSLHLLPAVKDPLRNEVIAMSLVYYFFGTQSIFMLRLFMVNKAIYKTYLKSVSYPC